MIRRNRGKCRWFVPLAGVAVLLQGSQVATAQSGGVGWGFQEFDSRFNEEPFVEVAGGSGFSLALRADGTIAAWGDTWKLQCDVPALPPGLAYVDVECGRDHAVALRSDGSVVAWGSNSSGQRDAPPLPGGVTYVEVSAGASHAVALRSDGAIVWWGGNFSGQCDAPSLPGGLDFVDLDAAAHRSVGIFVGWATCYPSFCVGDGVGRSVRCPCGNFGAEGSGCDNSASTGGARLEVRGSVEPGRILPGTSGEPLSALTIFIQGSSLPARASFGDGVRCIGGALKRIGVEGAVAGAASHPGPGDSSIRARSAALGDPIQPGS